MVYHILPYHITFIKKDSAMKQARNTILKRTKYKHIEKIGSFLSSFPQLYGKIELMAPRGITFSGPLRQKGEIVCPLHNLE